MPEPSVLPEPLAVLLSGLMLGIMALLPVEVLGSGMEVGGAVTGAGVKFSSTFLLQAPSASSAVRVKVAAAAVLNVQECMFSFL